MALRLAAARAAALAKTHGFRSLSSLSRYILPPAPDFDPKPLPKADPSENLFVVGLNKCTTSNKLRECFADFGQIVNAGVVKNKINGQSKGYGFVKYATVEEAAAALNGMDGQILDGWVIFVEYAIPEARPVIKFNKNFKYVRQ